MSDREHAVWQLLVAHAVGIAVAAVGMTGAVLVAPLLSNALSLAFYGVPLGAATPVWEIQWWEPVVSIAVLLAFLLVATVTITLSWRVSTAATKEVLAVF